jgi:hypothetical protein
VRRIDSVSHALAMMAGLTDRVWTITQIVELLDRRIIGSN